MTKFWIFLLALGVAVVLQTTIVDLISVADIRPNLPLLLLVPLVLRSSVIQSVSLAFLAGLFQDLIAGTPLGLSSLAFSLVAFMLRTATGNWIGVGYPRMIQVWSAGALVYESVVSGVYCLGSDLGVLGVALRYVIPSVVYDVAFGVIVLAALPPKWWRKL